MSWEQTLRDRLDRDPVRPDLWPVSIKLRAVSGCFHCRSCNPHLSGVIDQSLRRHWKQRTHRQNFYCIEHETGPEWIVYVAAGVTLSAAVINLVTAIIKARSDGQTKGDKKDAPIELIVRGFDRDGKMFEEKVLKLPPGETATSHEVRKVLTEGIQRQLPAPQSPPTKKPRKKGGRSKKGRSDLIFSDKEIDDNSNSQD